MEFEVSKNARGRMKLEEMFVSVSVTMKEMTINQALALMLVSVSNVPPCCAGIVVRGWMDGVNAGHIADAKVFPQFRRSIRANLECTE